MKKFGVRISLGNSWQFLSTLVIVVAALGLLLASQLETLLPGYSKVEVMTVHSIGVTEIIHNPLNAPYKVITLVINKIIDNPLLATRLSASIFGVATLGLFYVGIRHWHAKRTAFLAAVLFACSAWFLHVARFGAADILLPFNILLLAVSSYWIATSKHAKISYFVAILAIGLSIYTPGMVWFILLGIILRHNDIWGIRKYLSLLYQIALCVSFVVIIIAPLAYSIAKHPHIITALLGLPEGWPNIVKFAKDFILLPVNVFIWNPEHPRMSLGHLPYIDGVAGILFPLGVYYYFKFRSLKRAKLLALCFLIAGVLVALGGPVSMAIFLPLVYIVIAGGIALLLGQWLTVFPRNPFAKSLGIILLSVAIGISCIYNLRTYFVAWPNNKAVKSEFRQTSENLLQ